MTATLVNNITGEETPVHATAEHPCCSNGQKVWVDEENYAILQVGLEHKQFFYSIKNIKK